MPAGPINVMSFRGTPFVVAIPEPEALPAIASADADDE
jgi:hypothetical protein